MRAVTFIDAEIMLETGKITDFGAIRSSGESMHDASRRLSESVIKNNCSFAYVIYNISS